MINVYISQPMSKLTKQQVDIKRKDIINKIKKYFETEDINFLYLDKQEPSCEDMHIKNKDLYYLSLSIKDMVSADVVVMAAGWEHSRKCNIEHSCAKNFDILTIYEQLKYVNIQESKV